MPGQGFLRARSVAAGATVVPFGNAGESKEQPTAFTTSDLIVETLEKAGVRRVYGLPGESLNGFTDALRRNGVSAFLPEDIFTGS